jgi:hypothetical protein
MMNTHHVACRYGEFCLMLVERLSNNDVNF